MESGEGQMTHGEVADPRVVFERRQP
jgi:hypothetical protein